MSHQCLGVGAQLLAAVETHYRTHGLGAMTLDILEGNTAAQEFYVARG
jgi:ribosomal protein S18 acetylase RimI-like enzyme